MDLKGNISYRASLNGTISGTKKLSARIVRGGGGVSSYNDLTDLPSINNIVVEGDKNGHDYGLANLSDIPSIPVYNIITDDIILWTNTNMVAPSGDYALNDILKNYEYFYFDYYSPNDGFNYTNSIQTPLYPIPKSDNSMFVNNASWSVYPTYGNRSIDCSCNDLNSNIFHFNGTGQWDWPLIIYRMHGVRHRIGAII